MSTEQWKQAQDEWIVQNPIRLYRAEKGMTQTNIASIVGASLMAVQRWETAGAEPRAQHMDKLAELIGDDFKQRWSTWKERRPKM